MRAGERDLVADHRHADHAGPPLDLELVVPIAQAGAHLTQRFKEGQGQRLVGPLGRSLGLVEELIGFGIGETVEGGSAGGEIRLVDTIEVARPGGPRIMPRQGVDAAFID